MFDVTDPRAPVFQTYLVSRDFSTNAVGPDSGPEILRFITPQHSPTGSPLLVVANEITGSVNLFGLAATP